MVVDELQFICSLRIGRTLVISSDLCLTLCFKILLRQSADTVKKCSMELGGNAPFIVFNFMF